MPDGTDVPAEDQSQQPEAPEADAVETPPAAAEPATPAPEAPAAPAESKAPIKRDVHMMPVSKAQEEKEKASAKAKAAADEEWGAKFEKQRKEFETKLQNASPAEQNAEIEKWAKENDMDVKAASGLFNIIQKSLPKVDTTEYDAIVKDSKLQAQRAEVKTQIDTKVVDLIKKEHPGATPEQIEKAASEIAKLAFTEAYNTYPVEHIYALNKDSLDFEHGHSGEGDSGRTASMVHFDSVTEADEEKMTPEEYGKYSDYKARKGSRYTS